MSKRTWGILAVVVVIAAVAVVLLGLKPFGRKQEIAYRTEAVRRGDVNLQVSATGTLAAVTTVQVGSQVSGTISALYADFNDRVREKQVLAQLDPTFLKAQVAQSEADLDRSRVALRQAERDHARQLPLREMGLASQAEIDATETALDAARAAVKSSQAALERSQTNLRYATIASPIDGVVISRDVDVGQTVAASLSAPTLFTIAKDLTQMQLEAAVDEADIGMIAVGQQVDFTVDAFPEETFKGTVQQVRLAPQMVQNVVSYTVIVEVQNPEGKLLPGMTANATFLVDSETDVLKIPVAALRFNPGRGSGRTPAARPGEGANPNGLGSGGPPAAARSSVFVLDPEGGLRPVPVVPGLSDGTFTAVSSDSLREGDLVVVGMDASNGAQMDQGTVNPFAPGGGRARGGRR